MSRLASLVCALLLLGPVVRAEEEKAPPPKALELARLVLPESKYDEMLHNVAEVTEKSLEASAHDTDQVPPHFSERFEVEIRQMLQYSDLIQEHARLIARFYTAKEIDDLIAFYKTPVGQKSVDVMPRIMAAWTTHVQKRMEAGMPAALARIFPKKAAPPAGSDPASKADTP